MEVAQVAAVGRAQPSRRSGPARRASSGASCSAHRCWTAAVAGDSRRLTRASAPLDRDQGRQAAASWRRRAANGERDSPPNGEETPFVRPTFHGTQGARESRFATIEQREDWRTGAQAPSICRAPKPSPRHRRFPRMPRPQGARFLLPPRPWGRRCAKATPEHDRHAPVATSTVRSGILREIEIVLSLDRPARRSR